MGLTSPTTTCGTNIRELLERLNLSEDFSNLPETEFQECKDRSKSLRIWLWNLQKKLFSIRCIELHKEKLNLYFDELMKDENFNDAKMQKAELWILKGDWKFKKRKELELSDFYPSDDDVKKFIDRTFTSEEVINLLSELKTVNYARFKIEIERVKLKYQEEAIMEKGSNRHKAVISLSKEIAKLLKENNRLAEELAVIKRTENKTRHDLNKTADELLKSADEIKRLNNELKNLQNELDQLRNELFSERTMREQTELEISSLLTKTDRENKPYYDITNGENYRDECDTSTIIM